MDLLQSQIKESCNLALPEGLKDLMSDISREVLRSQPNDILQFIAHYLEALLGVREKLSVACHICNETWEFSCEPDLYDELKTIGLDEEDIESAIKIIKNHFEKGSVKEQTLFMKLAKKISIDEMQLTFIRDAIQKSFKRQHFEHNQDANVNKDVTNSVHHTLDIYKHRAPGDEDLFIQTYRACASISSTSLAGCSEKLQYERTYYSDTDLSVPENHHTSFDYGSTSTGKVKFIEEKVIYKIEHEDDTRPIAIDDNSDEDVHDNDDVCDEGNAYDDKDNDIEEMIKSESQDDTASSVGEDFALDAENDSVDTLQSL